MKKKLSTWLLVAVLAVASFLRLYNLEATQHFLGDQGRDSLIVAKILKEFDPVFIGPVTSIGNMYLGPLYYYFMAPWLWLSYPSPMGPIVAVAVIGILTVWLVYKLGKELVGKKPALLATILYSFASTVVNLSRFSWNPNPAPLFGLLTVYSLSRVWKGEARHWLWLGVWIAVLSQLHYMHLLAVGAVGLVWLKMFFSKKLIPQRMRQIKFSLGAILIICLSAIPLVLFDIKHQGLNLQAFNDLVLSGGGIYHAGSSNALQSAWQVISEMHGRTMGIMFELFLGKVRWLNTLLIFVFGWGVWQWRQQNIKNSSLLIGLNLLLVMVGVGIVGTSLYGHSVFDHYISYLFPIVFLIYGLVLMGLWKWSILGKLMSLALLAWFIWFNVNTLSFKPAGWQINDLIATSQTIAFRVGSNELYTIVLISPSGDLHGMNYKYFLYTLGQEPLEFSRIEEAQTLFVINEFDVPYNLASSPVREIQVFPNLQPDEVYRMPGGPEIVVLRK
ncbi:MAG: glycosyltransferase family 39 protein [Patescibacteria group bacterium]|nr:glycosyltransferase family 39 protein [Patescibacteria group bacterium]